MTANDHHGAHPGKIPPTLVLASASPRRRELLWQLGVPHRVAVADVREDVRVSESAAACVQRLALAKALKIWQAAEGPGEGLVAVHHEHVRNQTAHVRR